MMRDAIDRSAGSSSSWISRRKYSRLPLTVSFSVHRHRRTSSSASVSETSPKREQGLGSGWHLRGIPVPLDVSRQVIRQGLKELSQAPADPVGRIRRPGGGRKKAKQKDPTLVADLEKLVEPTTRGHPETCLRWTCNSVRKLAEDLNQKGHRVSYPVVAELLHELDYSLRANRKTREGDSHPDREAQFKYVDDKVRRYIAAGQPVISVDTKKKELLGNFKNGGREWRPQGESGKGSRARFCDTGTGTRCAVRGIRSGIQHRMGQRGSRS
jgi:hypothetical protein